MHDRLFAVQQLRCLCSRRKTKPRHSLCSKSEDRTDKYRASTDTATRASEGARCRLGTRCKEAELQVWKLQRSFFMTGVATEIETVVFLMNFNAERVSSHSLQSYFLYYFCNLISLTPVPGEAWRLTGAPTFRDRNISWQAIFADFQEALICAMATLHLL